MKLDRTQMIAIGLALFVIMFAIKQVSGYQLQGGPLMQAPSDVDVSQYNKKVSQYNKTWDTWLQGIISK